MKKSMKKLLGLICSFMLIVAALPAFSVFAEETAVTADLTTPDGVTIGNDVITNVANWKFEPENDIYYEKDDQDAYKNVSIAYADGKVTLTFADGVPVPTAVKFQAIVDENVYTAYSDVSTSYVTQTGDDQTESRVATSTANLSLSEANAPVENRNYTIKGWQTQLPDDVYAIDIYYDNDAIYCYNRGTYNLTTTHYEVKEIADDLSTTFAEKGVSATEGVYDVGENRETCGKWFGFDGTQNSIVIVNRSNSGLKCKATATSDTAIFGNTNAISLYNGDTTSDWYSCLGLKANSDATADDEGTTAWKLADFEIAQDATESAFQTAFISEMAKNARKTDAKRFGEGNTAVSGEAKDVAGVTDDMPGVLSYFYSITGQPNADLSNTGNETTSYTVDGAEKIGTIVFAFADADAVQAP